MVANKEEARKRGVPVIDNDTIAERLPRIGGPSPGGVTDRMPSLGGPPPGSRFAGTVNNRPNAKK
jgi:hypothetical protein